MSVHVCKTCGLKFEYCRACVFRPIRYKDLGFCSKKCYEASKNKIEEVVPAEDVEVVVIEEGTSTPTEKAIEYPYFFTETNKQLITSTEEPRLRKKRIKTIEEGQKEKYINDYKQNYGENV